MVQAGMSLDEEITAVRSTIRTDGYLMSIGEWISLYQDGEIDIHPEFQRFFRWKATQKTRLIESILLGIPVPPIFVAQREDGIWDVVDGLQRLSTIYEFVGILKNADGSKHPPLILEETKYLPSLKGKKWEDPDDKDNSLSDSQRRDIKRSKIAVSIVMKESDEKSKYELFQRLNSGGSALTPQEIRNCLMVKIRPELHAWLTELVKHDSFQETIMVNERLRSEQYDVELALRFIILRRLENNSITGLKDVSEFITDKMVDLAKDKAFDFEEEKRIFIETFDSLNRTVGSNAFRRYEPTTNRYSGAFSISAFEAIAIGLASPEGGNRIEDNELEPRIKELWSNREFTESWGAGKSASSRIPRLIPLGRRWFQA